MDDFLLINGKEYAYKSNYRDNEVLRKSFNNLTRSSFGFDFEQWYEDGYWKEKYVPYSLADGETVVANISVNIMDFLVLGEQKRYIQIGTVMTDKKYQGQGLSRAILEKVLKEWEDKCDLVYLFANDSVLDFYPKFGFIQSSEYQCSMNIIRKDNFTPIKKMDMSNDKDRKMLYDLASNTLSFSKITMLDNASLVMFYSTSFMKESIYYIEEYDAAIIANFDKDILYILDVFTTKEVQIERIINVMMDDKTKKIVLGFTPSDPSSYQNNLLEEENNTLFIKAGKENPFKVDKLMFPILSHA